MAVTARLWARARLGLQQLQSKETPSVAKVAGNASHATCPEGWMGPDEKGECWKLQITSRN
jgi:hypothetical protein